jgi:hypothetical protein
VDTRELQKGRLKQAKQKAFETFGSNFYLLDSFLGKSVISIVVSEGKFEVQLAISIGAKHNE